MCAVSMVTDHYRDRYPRLQDFPSTEFPNYLELVRKARLYDELNKQPDCPAPEKEQWAKRLEKYMRDTYGLEPKAI